MAPGVAEYRPEGKAPFRVLINEVVIKKMDKTFDGLPVYLRHVEDVDFDKNLMVGDKDQRPADGVVVKSFYNKSDGKHWVEFLVFNEKAVEAIRMKKWKLSNCYHPSTNYKGSGTWHGLEYDKEITDGEYEHLAIVQSPRYEESVIMTPDEFKAHNSRLEEEILRIANSKEKTKKGVSKMKFYKREKIENTADLEDVCIVLKNGKEMSIEDLVKYVERIENMAGYAAEDHMVKVGNEEMSVKDLVNKHVGMCNAEEEMKKKNAMDEEEAKKKNAEDEEKKKNMTDEEKAAEAKKNAEDADKDKDKDKDKDEDKSKNSKEENFNKLKNAQNNRPIETAKVILSQDRVQLGKSRYGAN